MKYNGKYCNDITHIRKKRAVMAPIVNSYADITQTIGQKLARSKKDILYLYVEMALRPMKTQANVDFQRERLAAYFNTDEPVEIVFQSEPHKAYYGIPEGDIQYNENDGINIASIVIQVPDGYAHATTMKHFKAALNSDGILEMTINNEGSVAVPVNYEIKMNHENGYVGIVSEHGIIELGDISEVDAVPAIMSQDITVNKNGNFSNWTNGTVFSENISKKPVTTMSADASYGGRLGILPASFSDTGGGNYFGAVKEYVWNDTASDWYLWARAWFETGLVEQTGMWTLAFADENDIPIAAMSIHKSSKTSNTAYVTFQVGTGEISKMNNVKQIQFTPSYWIPPNPYGSEGRDQNRNMFDLRKEGNKITFFWYGQYFPFIIPDKVAALKLKKIQFFAGQFKGQASNKRVTHMYINDLTLRKINVPYMRDEPNRYPEGSIITIDGYKKRPYFNNMPRLEDEVVGSKYFKAPPGETKVQFYYSDFSDPIPDVSATIREGYL